MSAAPDVGSRLDRQPAIGSCYLVLVIGDCELFSTSMTVALRSEGFDARSLPVAASVREFHLPDNPAPTGLVILDLDANGNTVNGADLVGDLKPLGWRVIVASSSVDRPCVAAAIASGAIGSLQKSQSFDVLLDLVMRTVAGEPVMTEGENQSWPKRHRRYIAQERELPGRLSRLSPREREVLGLLAGVCGQRQLPSTFVVRMPTVRTQIRSILAKLQVGSQLEAVAHFRQHLDSGHGQRPAIILRGRIPA